MTILMHVPVCIFFRNQMRRHDAKRSASVAFKHFSDQWNDWVFPQDALQKTKTSPAVIQREFEQYGFFTTKYLYDIITSTIVNGDENNQVDAKAVFASRNPEPYAQLLSFSVYIPVEKSQVMSSSDLWAHCSALMIRCVGFPVSTLIGLPEWAHCDDICSLVHHTKEGMFTLTGCKSLDGATKVAEWLASTFNFRLYPSVAKRRKIDREEEKSGKDGKEREEKKETKREPEIQMGLSLDGSF